MTDRGTEPTECPYECDEGLATSYGNNLGTEFFLPDAPEDPRSLGVNGWECEFCGPAEAWRGPIEDRWVAHLERVYERTR